MLVLLWDLGGKGSLDCLTMGQIRQKKGCLGEKTTGIEDMLFIFTKGHFQVYSASINNH